MTYGLVNDDRIFIPGWANHLNEGNSGILSAFALALNSVLHSWMSSESGRPPLDGLTGRGISMSCALSTSLVDHMPALLCSAWLTCQKCSSHTSGLLQRCFMEMTWHLCINFSWASPLDVPPPFEYCYFKGPALQIASVIAALWPRSFNTGWCSHAGNQTTWKLPTWSICIKMHRCSWAL